MQYIKLWPEERAVSRLGFGSSQLMGRASKSQSLRALEMAFATGINYIDVAPSYGYGDAERLVGRFLKGKRDQVLLATKFGIEVAQMGKMKRLGKMLARPLFTAVPAIRRAARGALGLQHQASVLSADLLRRSLERSLSHLGTDYIDVFLLHSCTAGVFQQDEVFGTLRSLAAAGKIRHFGLATDASVIAEGLTTRSTSFEVAQLEFGLLDQQAGQLFRVPSRLTCIAHSVFGGGGRNIERLRVGLAEIASGDVAPARLRAKLSPANADVIADAAINAVLRGTGVQIALCSMIQKAHIERNSRVVDSSIFNDAELSCIRDQFAGHSAAVRRQAGVPFEVRTGS